MGAQERLHGANGAATVEPARVVLHVGGLNYATEKAVVERKLGGQPGVLAVDANPVAQTATVDFDPEQTSVESLRRWVEECGYHCAGRSVPCHLCDPLAQKEPLAPALDDAAAERADEAHGHGGHAGMSMEQMVRDLRNRFLVALAFAIPIAIWSPIGKSIFGSTPPTPFGMRESLWQLLLSLPVVFYSSQIFFTGAWKALRAKTLDMMVLVAVAIGTGWLYSLAATFWIGGDVFYEASAFLATFVLLGHWFEMRARGGANDAIRALLDLAPPRAVVIRDGQELELPTAEVQVGELLLIRPGAKVPVDAEVLEGASSVDESMVTARACRSRRSPATSSSARRSTSRGRCGRARPRSALTPRSPRSSSSSRRRRTRRPPRRGSPTGRRSGSCSSPSSAASGPSSFGSASEARPRPRCFTRSPSS